jgi:hypothetical protein
MLQIIDKLSMDYIEGALNALGIDTVDEQTKEPLSAVLVLDQLSKIWPTMNEKQKKPFEKWFNFKPQPAYTVRTTDPNWNGDSSAIPPNGNIRSYTVSTKDNGITGLY